MRQTIIKYVVEELKKTNTILTKLNSEKVIDEDCTDMGELSEIIKFAKEVSLEVN